jgi:hypothetical protein
MTCSASREGQGRAEKTQLFPGVCGVEAGITCSMPCHGGPIGGSYILGGGRGGELYILFCRTALWRKMIVYLYATCYCTQYYLVVFKLTPSGKEHCGRLCVVWRKLKDILPSV